MQELYKQLQTRISILNFYEQAEKRLDVALTKQDQVVMEEWQKSVVTAADQCIPLRDIECELPFQPRRQVLNLLEKPGLQLIARRNPPYWTEYYGYEQPRYKPETYTVTARKSSSFLFGEVDHSKQ